MSVPSSSITVLSGVPLNSSYEHSLYFENPSDQTMYFLEHKAKRFDKYTYLRPGNVIKVAGDVANARSWNYLYFTNDAGKYYYHFIDKVVYLNDSAVELHITLDVIQTYMFDWDLKTCFIERTHTRSDEFGEHTVPEGLETGPLIPYRTEEINLEDNCILLMLACNSAYGNATGGFYDGVFSGLDIYAIPCDSNGALFLAGWLQGASEAGAIDSVLSMWVYPKKLVNINGDWSSSKLNRVYGVHKTIESTITNHLTGTTIDGVYIRNKKTFAYPYTQLYVSNNMGGCASYRRELFTDADGDYHFQVLGALSPDSGLQLVPNNYKKSGYNFEEALSMPPFPTCAWISDTYKVWLAQNQSTHELQTAQAIGQGVLGVGMAIGSAFLQNWAGVAGGVAMAGGSLLSVQNMMAQKADMSVQPDQARGNHSGNINLTHGRMGYTVYTMTVTGEYAEKIDDYFTRYGYQVNMFDIPRLKNRNRYTYIKTAGCTVAGPIGSEDQLAIQNIFNNGITFWATPDSVGDYFSPNAPLSEVTE